MTDKLITREWVRSVAGFTLRFPLADAIAIDRGPIHYVLLEVYFCGSSHWPFSDQSLDRIGLRFDSQFIALATPGTREEFLLMLRLFHQ